MLEDNVIQKFENLEIWRNQETSRLKNVKIWIFLRN